MTANEIMFDWGLGKNTWLGFDFYQAQKQVGNSSNNLSSPATVIQVDWNAKF
jgi:hypothetical protein